MKRIYYINIYFLAKYKLGKVFIYNNQRTDTTQRSNNDFIVLTNYIITKIGTIEEIILSIKPYNGSMMKSLSGNAMKIKFTNNEQIILREYYDILQRYCKELTVFQ